MPLTDNSALRAAGRLPLPALIILSAAGYGLLWLWFPLAPHAARIPPADIRSLAPGLIDGLAYALLLIALFVLLNRLFHRLREEQLGRRPLLVILGASALFAAPLLFTYPINATDIFGYVIRSRVASVYGENPYTTPPSAFVDDPFAPLIGEWAGETAPYGPVWELVAAGMTTTNNDLFISVLLFKGLSLACFLTMGALIWSLLPSGPSRAAYTILWAWNPALLLTFVVNGHNDALMLLWLLLGLWLGRRGRYAPGFLVMTLAALTKPVAVLALPFFFIGFLRELPSAPARLRFTATVLPLAALLAWLAFLPWAGPGEYLRAPVELTLRLVREATSSAGFSPAVWSYMLLGRQLSIEAIGGALRALFVVFVLWLLWRAWRGRSPLRGAADSFFGYMAQALSFRIWYAAWPFPWLLLDAGEKDGAAGAEARSPDYRLRVGLWFLLLSQLSVIVYGHLRVYVLGGDQTAAHLIGVPFTFLLPWLLALWPARLSWPARRLTSLS
jgi:hypothetical protein